jgi:hypothetical protein
MSDMDDMRANAWLPEGETPTDDNPIAKIGETWAYEGRLPRGVVVCGWSSGVRFDCAGMPTDVPTWQLRRDWERLS